MNLRKNSKGITLIALIVTVIVLLILAGITLALITGSEGILSKATNAVDENKIAAAKEQIELLLSDYRAEYYDKKYVEMTYGDTQEKYILKKLGKGAETTDYSIELKDKTINVYEKASNKITLTGKVIENGIIEWNSEVNTDNKIEKIASFETMLKNCGLEPSYTLEDVVQNKDNILTTILENTEAVDYIFSNPSEYLESFSNSETAVRMLAQNANTKKKIMNNVTWLQGIQNGSNANVLDENMKTIPVMTSNTTPSGEAIATNWREGNDPYLAFDGNLETYFYMNQEGTNDHTLIYKFDEIKSLYKISVTIGNPSWTASNNNFKIYISPDESGENWKQIKDDSWEWLANMGNEIKDETISLEHVEQVRRIKIYTYVELPNWNGQNLFITHVVNEIQAYGM